MDIILNMINTIVIFIIFLLLIINVMMTNKESKTKMMIEIITNIFETIAVFVIGSTSYMHAIYKYHISNITWLCFILFIFVSIVAIICSVLIYVVKNEKTKHSIITISILANVAMLVLIVSNVFLYMM